MLRSLATIPGSAPVPGCFPTRTGYHAVHTANMNPAGPPTSMAEDESESAWPFFDFDFEPRGSFGFAGLSNSSTVSTDSTAVSTDSRSTLERLLEDAYKTPKTPQPFSPTSSTGHFSDGWGGPSWATSAGSYPPTRSPQGGPFPPHDWQQFGASEGATTRASEVAVPLTHGFSQQPIIINHYHYHQPPPVKAAPAPRRRSPKAPGQQTEHNPTAPLTPILCRQTPGVQFQPPGERADPFVIPATLSLGAASINPTVTHPSVNIPRPDYRVPLYQEPQKRPGFVQPGRQNKRARAQGPSPPPEQLNPLEDHLPFGKRPEHAEALRELDNFRLEALTNPNPIIGSLPNHPRRARKAAGNGSSRMSNFLQGALDRFVACSLPNGEDLEEPVGATGEPGDRIPPRT
jgi:hypothetical protein